MKKQKSSPFDFGEDAPDIGHQILAGVFQDTGDPAYAWAADAVAQHYLQQKVPVTFETAPPRFDRREWICYAQALQKEPDVYPLTTAQMLELSILTTHMLREALPCCRLTYMVAREIADCIRIEWQPARDVYVGPTTLQPRQYDREILPVFTIDRKRLYQHLATLSAADANTALYSLYYGLRVLAEDLNEKTKYSDSNSYTANWTKKREVYQQEAPAFIAALETVVPQSLEEESRFPVYLEHHGDTNAYANTLRTLNEFLDWHKQNRPGKMIENPGGRCSEHVDEKVFSTPTLDMQPYLDALQADKAAFRKAQIARVAQDSSGQPTLLDLMEKPDEHGVASVKNAGKLLFGPHAEQSL